MPKLCDVRTCKFHGDTDTGKYGDPCLCSFHHKSLQKELKFGDFDVSPDGPERLPWDEAYSVWCGRQEELSRVRAA